MEKLFAAPTGSFMVHKKKDKSVRPLNKFPLLGKMFFMLFGDWSILRRGKLCASDKREREPLCEQRNCAVNRHVCFEEKCLERNKGTQEINKIVLLEYKFVQVFKTPESFTHNYDI